MVASTAVQREMPWWVALINGIASLILGLLLISSPGMSTLILIQFMGFYWLIDGIISIVRIFTQTSDLHWGWLLARGILGILAGLAVINNPLWSTILIPTVLVIILGVQGIIGGIIGMIEGFKGGVKWGAVVVGAIGIIFGLILLTSPFMAALALPIVAGVFAIFGGIMAIIFSFQMRSA
ncbi:MAG: DUF308 domain-containing protein [Anaerolineae bacterium]|nr:DUF308 domain-containing protein [Anaerolineae bacterium]